MADNAGSCGTFGKMFDADTNPFMNNPFVKMFGDVKVPLGEPVKEMAAKSLDSGEKWARQAVEMNEKATEWAKDTPLASVFETQRAFALQVIDSSTAMARRIWQIEAAAEAAPENPSQTAAE